MKLEIRSLDINYELELTTDSAQSSCGLPVLRVNGQDHGPADWIDGQRAGDLAVLAKLPGTLTFLQQCPQASKWWDLDKIAAWS